MLTGEQWRVRVSGVLLLVGSTFGLFAAASHAQVLELEEIARGLSMPVGVTHAGDGSGRLFLLQQPGQVLIYENGATLSEPFLNIAPRITCCGERGLLGLAFHPNYRNNGRFFVNYTDTRGDTVVSEFEVSADPNRADAGSEVELLTFSQPFGNHNGGHIAFGPDGFLYIASGDGGSGGDPQNNGQDTGTLLGKILRIDVDRGGTFAIPSGNPFAGTSEAEEIWAYGLRNPWRFSFDRNTGDLYIGDVGQGAIEEINFQPASSRGGENYGWRLMEGNQCFDPGTGCNDGSLDLPVLQYSHAEGCSVTAGFRYRGPEADTLPRFYLYGDFCSGRIWGGRSDSAGRWRARQLASSGLSISSFGEGEDGNVYVVDYGGRVYLLKGNPLFAADFESLDVKDWSASKGGLEVVSPGLAKSEGALQVPVDGSSRKRFLRSNQPSGEGLFEASFRLNPNRVDLDEGEVEILHLEGSPDPVVVTLDQRGRKYFLRLWVREGGTDLRLIGDVKVPRKRATLVAVEFMQARTANGTDGEVSLSKKGRVRIRASGLSNGNFEVDSVAIGLPAGSEGAIEGAFLIDDYTSSP